MGTSGLLGLGLAVALPCLGACSTAEPVQTSAQWDDARCDREKMALIDEQVSKRGHQAVWISCPQRPISATAAPR